MNFNTNVEASVDPQTIMDTCSFVPSSDLTVKFVNYLKKIA